MSISWRDGELLLKLLKVGHWLELLLKVLSYDVAELLIECIAVDLLLL